MNAEHGSDSARTDMLLDFAEFDCSAIPEGTEQKRACAKSRHVFMTIQLYYALIFGEIDGSEQEKIS